MSRPRTGNKEERLINAAIELFAENGFFYTTTAEVSARAGVAAGTLYLYFNSKDELLVASLAAFLDKFALEVLPQVRAAESAEEKLRAFVTHFLQLIEHNRASAQVFFGEFRQNNRALRNAVSRVGDRYYSMIGEIVAELRREGMFQTAGHEVATAMLLGPIEQIAVRWLLDGETRAPTTYAEGLSAALATIARSSAEMTLS